jgi:hypothetical protein
VFVSNIGTRTGTMSIVNTLGQTVYTGKLQAETNVTLAKGVYIVKLDAVETHAVETHGRASLHESQKIVVK